MKYLRLFITNILTGGINFTDDAHDPEISSKIVLLNVLCLLNAFFAFFRAIEMAASGNRWIHILLFAVMNFIIMIYVRISKSFMPAAAMYVISHIVLIPIYNIYSATTRGFALSSIDVPVEMIFLLGNKKGVVASAAFLVVTLGMLWILHPVAFTEAYHEQVSGYIWLFVIVSILVGFIEYLRAEAYTTVKSQKKSLESVVARLNSAYRELSEKEKNYHDLVQKTNSIIIKMDGQGIVSFINHHAQEFFGYSEDEIVGRHVIGTIVPELDSDGNDQREFFEQLLRNPSEYEINETENMIRDGRRVWIYWTNRPRLHSDGSLKEIISIGNDISDRKKEEEKMCHLATHDTLTGLPNRLLFYDRLEQSLNLSERTGEPICVMMLDLDRFKAVNDTHGHDAGDLLLQQVALRISGLLRKSDTVGRVGGDEFLILLTNVGYAAEACNVGSKIIASLEEPFNLDGVTADISGSIGIAMYPDHGGDPETLIKNADQAMYAAKRGGRGKCVGFNASVVV